MKLGFKWGHAFSDERLESRETVLSKSNDVYAAHLICVFVFAYANQNYVVVFSHDAAHIRPPSFSFISKHDTNMEYFASVRKRKLFQILR